MSRFSHANRLLWFSCLCFTFGDILFGFDTGIFGSLQALPSWTNTFGTQGEYGNRSLTTQEQSIANSVVWIGKGMGTILFEPLVERFGYLRVMYLVCALQFVAITVTTWGAFSAGRTVAYLAVGLVENAVPSYTSEISPAPLRGFFTGSLLTFVLIGNVLGTGTTRAYATEQSRKGWLIPTALQFLPAVILGCGLPFCPESPRWLVSQGQNEKALKNLNRLRTSYDIDNGATRAEIEAFQLSIEESKKTSGGSWSDLFRGTMFRRVMIAVWIFIFQQITGQQFINAYGPTFYIQMGLGTKAFTYQMLPFALSIFACAGAQLLYDRVGRRPILIFGCVGQVVFMFLVAGLGTKSNKTTSDVNGVVASIIIFYVMTKISLSNLAYLIGSEIGGTRMRKKVMAFATFWDVVAAFVVTYSVPYLLRNPLYLGAKVGWIFGGIASAALIFSIFFVPELKGRSLEETDELFALKLWAWQFDKVQTHGVGSRIARLEQRRDVEQADELEMEDTAKERDIPEEHVVVPESRDK